MTILDLRPGFMRTWQDRAAGAGNDDPVGRLWTGVVDRFMAHRHTRRTPPPGPASVVSVGNLALGGTGKTPVTIALARDLAARGQLGAVLTRGYGSRLRGPLVVDPGHCGSGDEARLMAAELADTAWLVVQSRNRAAGLAWLAARHPNLDTILLEDAHQTAVGRHLDVLILDRWRLATAEGAEVLDPAAGPVVPWGPWRESVQGAARADIVLVESENAPARTAAGQPVAAFVRELRLEREVAAGTPWLALSGIARPESFERGAAEALDREPAVAIRCRDHADYEGRLGERVLGAVRAVAGAITITTAKDWIKLRSIWPADLPVVVARQELVWHGKTTLPALVGERLSIR
ncbi:MAG: tetraacyldisaccharide 4'-kinase [bacterium]|nr:tetraacyldisaccharide 4'-kinase [bacterium]